MITVLYPNSKVRSGFVNYSIRLLRGFDRQGVKVKGIPIRKIELGFTGKPVLGNLSQFVMTRFVRPEGQIIHSLTPNVICPSTNIVTIHDTILFEMREKYATNVYRKLGYNLLIRSIEKVPYFIVFTQESKKKFSYLMDIEKERIEVVSQSIDHSVFYRDVNDRLKEEGRRLIITVGDLNPRKRYDLLFKALGGKDEYSVVHIGPVNGWYARKRELDHIIRQYKNIKMIGEVSDSVLREYMSTADLLVHLSEGEGFGYTPIESMACGTNVLVNDLDIFHETLNGYGHFTGLEEPEIRDKVAQSLLAKKSPDELINYTRKFSIERMAESTIDVYRKISDKI